MYRFIHGKRWVKEIVIYLSLLVGVLLLSQIAHAGEMDILVNKLVEKGILTPGEAQTIITETREEARKQVAQGKHEILPQWIQNTSVKGDFRLREQWEQRDGESADRWRTRFRYRLGIESKVTDEFKVGVRITSGGSDPRSTNQSLQDTFSGKSVRLDMAYGQYTNKWLTFMGGKFKKPVWTVSDLMWDEDINPEGAAAQFNYKCSDMLGWFLNTAVLVLDENQNRGNDPFMAVIQPGFEWKIKDKEYKDIANLQAAITYYNFTHVEGALLDNSAKTNTTVGSGNTAYLKYDYNSFDFSTQFGMMPTGFIVPYVGIFGDFIYNPDPDRDNKGFQVGFMFGVDKVKERGQWQALYSWRRLERDAVLDIFPDSDFAGGRTNVQGHEAILTYGIGKNTNLKLDYYQNKEIRGDTNEKLLQFDWNLSF